MTDLEKQAQELGIKVDGRWSEERLQEEIDKALAAPKAEQKPKVEKLFPIKLVRNYRPVSAEFFILDEEGDYREPTEEECQKVTAGNSIKLPVQEAQSAVDKKIAERNDPIR